MQNLQLIAGHPVIELTSVDSTNNYATKLLKEGQIGHGTVILSGFQDSGKGQRGNLWQSEASKNLLLSYVVTKPLFTAESQYFANKAVALAVGHFVQSVSDQPCHIKWPNDILLNKTKLAGILIENSWRAQELAHCVIGIGLNVNQTEFDGIDALSLRNATGEKHDIKTMLKGLLESMDLWLQKLSKGKFEEIDAAYHELLFRLHENGEFQVGARKIHAKVVGVTEEGELLLEEAEIRRKYQVKEISFIY